jgi:hypothetical protein
MLAVVSGRFSIPYSSSSISEKHELNHSTPLSLSLSLSLSHEIWKNAMISISSLGDFGKKKMHRYTFVVLEVQFIFFSTV